ncbi:antirestriction protein ArdA [Candidatus Bathycorpusculum sp.]|uniref:antirestriction protein ArdA n=1 Tax=Candidatus Bathycorpusculum sp. TaxID=2994959 RepID=UPI00282FC518|nr:antirestriction protein ArdA [Candidatus Termitimicrobium sp.]MCL2432692.1 antirestriction protein ArdA [Candidatus Termitimicrobium sp.]
MSIQSQIVKPEVTPTTTTPQLRVYVVNLRKYSEGELAGGWINLPASNQEIQTFLTEVVGLDEQYEEYSVQDYESIFSLEEFVDLYDLNLLAVKLEGMLEGERTVAAYYCMSNGIRHIIDVVNVCEQLSDLVYTQLEAVCGGSREERLGYLLAQETGLEAELEQVQLSRGISAADYFDYERYGRDIAESDGYFVTADLFIHYTGDLDEKRYTREELRERLDDSRLTVIA